MKRVRSGYVLRPEYQRAESRDAITLSQDQVHLWKASLDQTEEQLQAFEGILTSDERGRADRFRFERDRRRFVAARGQLRMILAGYLDIPPSTRMFSYEPRGKPFLTQQDAANAVKFNLSHSGEIALIALTRGRGVGVDIEEMRPIDDAEQIAERFFSPRENGLLQSLSREERLEAFFSLWTLKESYLKASGEGLERATDSFDVCLGGSEPARLVTVEGMPEEASRWSLLELAPAPGYVGAVAVEGQNWTLSCWQTIPPAQDVNPNPAV